MNIKKTTNCFFNYPKGIIVDNSYDLYVLSCLIKFYKENKVQYLHSQDYDLGFLKSFPNVKFLSFSEEAINFDALNNLTELIGLSILSSQLKYVALNIFEKLEYLEIIFNDNSNLDFSLFKSLKHLRIVHLPHKEIKVTHNLETIEIDDGKKITSLVFLEETHNIKEIKLNYLPKLESIDSLKKCPLN